MLFCHCVAYVCLFLRCLRVCLCNVCFRGTRRRIECFGQRKWQSQSEWAECQKAMPCTQACNTNSCKLRTELPSLLQLVPQKKKKYIYIQVHIQLLTVTTIYLLCSIKVCYFRLPAVCVFIRLQSVLPGITFKTILWNLTLCSNALCYLSPDRHCSLCIH